MLDDDPYRDSERGDDEAEDGARGHVRGVVLVVRDPSERGKHREEGAANLDQETRFPDTQLSLMSCILLFKSLSGRDT